MVRRLSIIGTAGRRDDAARINRALYDKMYAETVRAIREWDIEEVVSGGAAVSDHLAVRAFLDGAVARLTLFLPAHFDRGRFTPNPHVRFNPGQTCNQYHAAFSRSCGLDSLAEINEAIHQGARVEVFEGFHRRNSEVADNCTHMLAFTFGNWDSHAPDGIAIPCRDFSRTDHGFSKADEAGLKDGGTAHTWGEAYKAELKRHVHVGILARRLTSPAEVKV